MNVMIVKATMHTGVCYGLTESPEIAFRKSKMIKGEELAVLGEKMDALDTNKNEICKFLVCKTNEIVKSM